MRWGNDARWGVALIKDGFPDFDQAEQAALELTSSFVPRNPWSVQERQVFRISEASYLVNVVGATTEFHFRVSVAERIEP